MKKSNGIFKLLLILVTGVLGLTGCLKNQEDYFELSPSARITGYLAKTRDILISQPNGWLMPYYYDKGGETYCLSFTQDSVFVHTARENRFEKGLYRLITYSGPVLSFDSYLSPFHQYAEAGDNGYLGARGDFEFLITKVDAADIRLKGLRWDQPSTLTPLQTDPERYMQNLTALAANVPSGTYEGALDGINIRLTLSGSGTSRTIALIVGTGLETSLRCTFSDTGLLLADPITVKEWSSDILLWEETTQSFDADGLILTLIDSH